MFGTGLIFEVCNLAAGTEFDGPGIPNSGRRHGGCCLPAPPASAGIIWGHKVTPNGVKTMVFGLLTSFGSGCPGFQAKWSHGDPDRVILAVFDQVLGLRQYQRSLQGHFFWGKSTPPFGNVCFLMELECLDQVLGLRQYQRSLQGHIFLLSTPPFEKVSFLMTFVCLFL